MATNTLVSDLIVCPICYEIYQDPKSLPQCLHTFCKSCIKSYVSNSIEVNKTEFYCPVCRKCYHVTNLEEWVDTLPHNHLIVSLTDQEKMESKEPLCDCCKRLGNFQPATSWCQECCDQFCENCVKFHQVSRLTMEHKVCNIAEQSQKSNLSVDLFCKQHSSRRLEVYCFDHEEPCCLMCATVSHRKCEKVNSLDDCAQNCSADVLNICSRVENLQKACDNEIHRLTNDMGSLEKESKDVEHRVKTMTEEVIKALKDKERVLLENLKQIEKEQTMSLQNTLDEYVDVKKNIENDVQIMKNSDGLLKIALFLELKRIEKKISKAHIDISKLKTEYQTYTLDVHIDETVQAFPSSFDSFGEIKVRGENEINYQSGQLVLERSITVDGASRLTDVDVIDDCYIVTTCQDTKMVYVLDKNGKQLSSLKLIGCPWGIAVLQNKTFCVSLRNRDGVCLFKVHEDVSLSLVLELKEPQNVWGICAIEDIFIASIEDQQNGQIFRFYDQKGNLCEEHTITTGSSECGAMHATSNKSLLFTHHDGHSLYSVDVSESKLQLPSMVYQGNNMNQPIGVACDPNKNTYVACYGSSNVLQFDAKGKFLREIIKADSAVKQPYGIRIKRLGDNVKLIVTTKGKLLVYEFK